MASGTSFSISSMFIIWQMTRVDQAVGQVEHAELGPLPLVVLLAVHQVR